MKAKKALHRFCVFTLPLTPLPSLDFPQQQTFFNFREMSILYKVYDYSGRNIRV